MAARVFQQSEAFSFQVATDNQEETDRYWNAIVGNGGQESSCGWCKDRWGLSWQITPRVLMEALSAGGAEAKRAFDGDDADEEDRRRQDRGSAARLTWSGRPGDRAHVLRSTILPVTRERWAQIGITIEFLIVVRTLGEFFRLRHTLGTNFSIAVATPYVGGGLIAVCSCWAAVTLYFVRRYTLSAVIALATVPALLAYKIAVIGR